nr:MAG TPA: hypothetical protein [Caudoviricetes sp.]
MNFEIQNDFLEQYEFSLKLFCNKRILNEIKIEERT